MTTATPPTNFRVSARTLASVLPRGGTIFAETAPGGDDRLRYVRLAAAEIALGAGARVVLYDSTAESYFTDPYPSGPWTADIDGPHGERPLAADELDALGRRGLRDQLIELARLGAVDAVAWLPQGVGARAIADAARRGSADLFVRAARRRRSPYERFAAWVGLAPSTRPMVPMISVEPDGRLVVEHLTCSLPRRRLGLGAARTALGSS